MNISIFVLHRTTCLLTYALLSENNIVMKFADCTQDVNKSIFNILYKGNHKKIMYMKNRVDKLYEVPISEIGSKVENNLSLVLSSE